MGVNARNQGVKRITVNATSWVSRVLSIANAVHARMISIVINMKPRLVKGSHN
jgi:hypothetical protein